MENFENIICKIKQSHEFSGEVKLNEPLAQKTTFKVGGNTSVFIAPETIKAFQIVLQIILQNQIKFFILGGGSNIVFPDETFQGIILSTQKLTEIKIQQENSDSNNIIITCNSGASIASFVNFCTKNNLSGAEQFAGLPGTIGGAVFMNARCFEKSISDLFVSATYLDFSKNSKPILKEISFDQNQWKYKKSPFQNGNKLILSATFKLTQKTPEDHTEIEQNCKKYISERVDKGHFKYPSAGSVFKNNHEFGKPSGKIIDEAGLKGYRIGGAQIAPFHGNFIINIENATAKDIKELVEYTQKIVYEKFSFILETEIIFVDK